MQVYEIKAKTIFTKTGIPGLDWAINPYSGCEHACVYCYARFICRWRTQRRGLHETWGEFVDIKVNAPELVLKENKNKRGSVFLSSVADPYQPLERKYQLTRQVLENLNPNLELSILTKSDLILRDMDVLKRFKKLEIGFSITLIDDSIKKIFEPYSPPAQNRIKVLKILKAEGFSTYCFVAPILPYLTNVEEIFEQTSGCIDYLIFDRLNMYKARKPIMEIIQRRFPNLKERYRNLSDKYWEGKRKQIIQLKKRYKANTKLCF